MRIRLSYFFLLFFALFLPNLSFASPITGPLHPEAVLAMKPELIVDTSGIRYWDVPVQAAGTTGVARIAESRAVGAVLGVVRGNAATLAIMAAYEAGMYAADLCWVDNTKYLTCQQKPIMPITLDISQIVPATLTPMPLYAVYSSGFRTTPSYDPSTTCQEWMGIVYSGLSNVFVSATPTTCNFTHNGSSLTTQIKVYSTSNVYTCDSGSVLTNSSGVPMPATGQFCIPDTAYSCEANYYRTDSSGNVSSTGMFCSYESPVITDTDAAKMLAPYLLNYYANQLLTGKDGKPLSDAFSAPDTTFDPAVTPSTMPMTWEQLKNYVDWVRNGLAQTTDPLAPHYITPNNYDYTKSYINTNNTTNSTINNSTSSANTTITPEQATSSAAMTQTEYEESNKKADTEQATALNTAMNPLTNVLTQYNADKQFMIDKITSPTEPPAAMPDIFTWAWPTGQCQGFTLKFRVHVPLIGMLSMDKLVNEHCPPYNEWAHPALFWFFNIITGLYLFRLWDKTAAEVVRI